MFGYRLGRVATAEEAASPDPSPILSGIIGGVAPIISGTIGGVVSGRNAALVAEQLPKPAAKDRGGLVEMEWIAASAERELKVDLGEPWRDGLASRVGARTPRPKQSCGNPSSRSGRLGCDGAPRPIRRSVGVFWRR